MTASLQQASASGSGSISLLSYSSSPITVKAGSLIVLVLANGLPLDMVSSVTDNQQNIWTKVATQTLSLFGTSQIWFCQTSAAGPLTVTATALVSLTWEMTLLEYSQVLANPLDVYAKSGEILATKTHAASITPSQGAEVLVAAYVSNSSAQSLTINSGFGIVLTNSTSPLLGTTVASKVTTTQATQTATFTSSTALQGMTWLVGFKSASSKDAQAVSGIASKVTATAKGSSPARAAVTTKLAVSANPTQRLSVAAALGIRSAISGASVQRSAASAAFKARMTVNASPTGEMIARAISGFRAAISATPTQRLTSSAVLRIRTAAGGQGQMSTPVSARTTLRTTETSAPFQRLTLLAGTKLTTAVAAAVELVREANAAMQANLKATGSPDQIVVSPVEMVTDTTMLHPTITASAIVTKKLTAGFRPSLQQQAAPQVVQVLTASAHMQLFTDLEDDPPVVILDAQAAMRTKTALQVKQPMLVRPGVTGPRPTTVESSVNEMWRIQDRTTEEWAIDTKVRRS